jgi:hypothetical protein
MGRPLHTLDFSRNIPLVLSVLIRERRLVREKSRELARRRMIAVQGLKTFELSLYQIESKSFQRLKREKAR